MKELKEFKSTSPFIKWFDELRSTDVGSVGGKNSSLGEMVTQLAEYGIPVPPGFATTPEAYWAQIDSGDLKQVIVDETELLQKGEKSLADVGHTIRSAVSSAPL